MRRIVVASIIVAITGLFAFLLITRERTELPGIAKATASPVAGASGTAATATGGGTDEAGNPTAKVPTKVTLGRPLRVVSHGWDLLVPGLLAKSGGAYKNRGLEVEARSVTRLDDIQKALAAGGDDAKGADIAIMALPLLAITYEDLRALKPQLFWTVGFSRGRDALYGETAESLRKPTRRASKTTVVGDKDRASMFFSLFALDLAGVDLTTIRVLDQKSAALAKGKGYAAIDRALISAERASGGKSLLLSSAEATDLIPYVAIASEGFLAQHSEAAKVFASGWLAGVEELRRDVPKAIRGVAALEGTPEPVVLLKQVGQIEFVGLADNARLLALSGRGAVTAHALFRESFRIWRSAQVITTPGPEVAPINADAVTALVFAKGAEAPTAAKATAPVDAAPLVVTTSKKLDEDAAVERVGLVAGLFARSVLEVGFNGKKTDTDSVIARASERFGIDPDRLLATPKRSKRKALTLAVMPIP